MGFYLTAASAVGRRKMRLLELWVGLAALLLLVACRANKLPSIEAVIIPSIAVGETVPRPSEPTVLTIEGAISVTNQDNVLAFDMPTLESLGTVSYSVPDPWLQTDVIYEGVLLSDLLAISGASEHATVLVATALDDYQVDLPLGEIDGWPVLVAIRANDLYMGVAESGPVRIIFPYQAFPDITSARNMSVWSLARLTVK